MRSIRYNEVGGPEVLYVTEEATPEPNEGRVVVAVRAVGLNPFDGKVRAGLIPMTSAFPRGLGGDFSGVVVATGDNAVYFDGAPVAVGDEVLGWGVSTLREAIRIPAASLARKPASVSFAVAGSLSTPGQTANASFDVLNPGHGDTILVSAAAGAVGFIYSQLAVAAGARVIGTASAANHDRLRAVGIEPTEYGAGLAERVRALALKGLTGVQDNAGGETIDVALELGVPPERICEIVDHEATERLSLATPGQVARRADVLQRLVDLVADGELHLEIQQEFSFDEVAAAFTLLEGRHLSGKVVVTP